ncbi:MAG: glutathione peroxidase [Bacteroidia bacterium]|nr:glutathione peroxidase [Bacteroidia bacterium]
MVKEKTFQSFTAKTIEGTDLNFSTLKGKKVLVVNTASLCGFTPQYEALEQLFQKYKDKNFTIVGFPANNFGEQEPGSNAEIKEFCKKNYGVSFQMMEKVSVKGADQCAVYAWLTKKAENGVMDSEVRWNFQKYLIDETGKLVDVVGPKESPMSEKITSWIEGKASTAAPAKDGGK